MNFEARERRPPPASFLPRARIFAPSVLMVVFALLLGAAACGDPEGGKNPAPRATAERDQAPAAARAGARPPWAQHGDRRLILIGLDAADERLIAAGITAGSLPNLARMVREGASGPLRTHRPILSPILWTSMATGVTPERHGVLDFVEVDGKGNTIPVTARSRRVPAFWNVLGARGVACGIVAWLATYPAETVNGFMISDRFTIHPFEADTGGQPAPRRTERPGRRAEARGVPEAAGGAGRAGGSGPESLGKTYPPELYAALGDTIVDPASVGDQELLSVFGAPRARPGEDAKERRELRVIEAVARTYTDAALRLDQRERPDLLAVYFEAIDRLMHLFGGVMPPPLPGVSRLSSERYGRAVERFYAAMDTRLGRFLEAAGGNGTVIVVSDHGFKIGDERPRHSALRSDVFAAEWHRDPGVILAWGKGVRRGARIEGADIYDVTPTILAYFGAPASETMRGRALEDIFEPGFLPPAPPRLPATDPTWARRGEQQGRPESTASAPAPEEREILENLRALGYVGGGSLDGAARASSNLATFYLDEKQFGRAIELYKQVLAQDPSDLTALYNLGYAYKGLGSHAKAAECFERLLRDRPDYTEARLVLSDCYVALGRVRDALTLMRAKEAEGRADSAFQNHLGTILASAGRLAEAARALERAIALRPSEASPYLNLARVQLARGDRTGAVAALRRAERAAPGDPRVAARLQELTGAPR